MSAHNLKWALPLVAAILALAGPGAERSHAQEGVQELTWDQLMPADYRLQDVLEAFDAGALDDSDPRAVELMNKLRELWNNAPVVEALDGKTVRLPGYVVPLEGDGERVSEFLLVPYFGACIHVPPLPSNQIVYVVTEGEGAAVNELFAAVWVTGTLSAKRTSSELADAGYSLRATKVEPYQ